MRENVKNAFILAVVGNGVAETFLIFYLLSLYTGISIFDGITTTAWIAIGVAVLTTAIVCAGIALSTIKKITDIKRSERVFYILTRILSLITIIASAIFLGILLIVFLIYTGMR